MADFNNIPEPKEENKEKSLPIKIRFAGLFSSLAFIVYTTIILMYNFSIDKYFLIRLLTEILPATIILGILGYSIGNLIDETKR